MQVVLLGAALVGVAFEGDLLDRSLLDAVGQVVELRPGLGGQRALVEGEVDGRPVALVGGGLRADAGLTGLAGAAVSIRGAGVGHALVVLAPGARAAVAVGGAGPRRALAVGAGGARGAVLIGGALRLGDALVGLADE